MKNICNKKKLSEMLCMCICADVCFLTIGMRYGWGKGNIYVQNRTIFVFINQEQEKCENYYDYLLRL